MHTCNRLLFTLKNEVNPAMCDNIDELGRNNLVSEIQILWDSFYFKISIIVKLKISEYRLHIG